MDFCSDHKQLNDMVIRIDENVKILVKSNLDENIEYKSHVKESDKFRAMILTHEQILKDICDLKRWWLGAVVTVIVALISLAVIWGGLLVKVEKLEKCVYAGEGK
jgi:hypothetical protein